MEDGLFPASSSDVLFWSVRDFSHVDASFAMLAGLRARGLYLAREMHENGDLAVG